jgi:hypothetical protein
MTESIENSDDTKSQPQKIPKENQLTLISGFLDIEYKELEIKT